MRFYQLSLIAFACAATLGTSAHGAVIVDAYYHLGEADPGAIVGQPSNSTTTDSGPGGHSLTGSGTYAAGNPLVPNASSTFSITSGGGGGYSTSVFAAPTDNFGIETFLQIPMAPYSIERTVPVFNGNSGANGYGFFTGPDTNFDYGGLYGGVHFLDSGIAEHAGDNVYLALVDNAGTTTMYVEVNGGPLQTISFGTLYTPLAATGTLNLGPGFSGTVDETRLFQFAPGGFNTNELLINLPEPSSVVLSGLGAVGLFVAARRRRKA